MAFKNVFFKIDIQLDASNHNLQKIEKVDYNLKNMRVLKKNVSEFKYWVARLINSVYFSK